MPRTCTNLVPPFLGKAIMETNLTSDAFGLNESIIAWARAVGSCLESIIKSAPIKTLDWLWILSFRFVLNNWMDTTAAIPRIIDAINRNKRTLLALASRQAILKSQEICRLIFNGESFT